MKVEYPLIIKGKTNDGNPCKQTVHILTDSKKGEPVVLIMKYVLTDDSDYDQDFFPVKSFKGKTLYRQAFAIRIRTLGRIVDWLNDLTTE